MHKRRSLFVSGVLLAALLLVAPTVAFAQGEDPAKPVLSEVFEVSYETIRVRWSSVTTDENGAALSETDADDETITKYTVLYREGSGSENDSAPLGNRFEVEDVDKGDTQADITDLDPDTQYVFSLLAVNKFGDSMPADTLVERTDVAPMPDRVPKPSVTELDMSLKVDWDAPAAGASGLVVTHYMVMFQEDKGTWLDQNPDPTISEATITRLKNDTLYNVRVKAVNGAGGESASWSLEGSGTPTDDTDDMDDMEPLDAPMVTVGEPTHNSVMVSWMAVDGATSYNLSYRMDGGRPINVWQDMDMEYTITGLMPDTMYTVWVCADGDDDASSCSENKSFKTLEGADGTTDPGTTDPGTTGGDGVAPGAPEKVVLRTATRTDTTITISWEPPGSGMTRLVDYQMEVEEAGQVIFTNNITPEQVSVQERVIPDLKPLTSYRIRLKAQNRVQGYGQWSEWQTVTTLVAATTPRGEETVAGAPLQVVLRPASTTKTTTTITVYWDIPGSGASRLVDYQVSYSAVEGDPGFTNNVDVTADPPVSHTIRGLTAGKFYYIRVRAQNLQGYGHWSAYLAVGTAATPGAPPAGPAISKMAEPMVEAGDMMLMVSWAEPASHKSITHYLVAYKTASAAQWLATPKNVTAMEYTIDGLINGTAYLVRVRAVDSAGAMGEWSDSGSGTPMAMEEPEEPMPTPALPIFGALALGLGLVAAGRRRLRRRELRAGRVQQQITR